MFTLEIGGNTYEFNFNIGFMKAMNKKYKEQVARIWGDDARANMGLFYAISSVFVDDDIEALVGMLVEANKMFEPKVSEKLISEYIDDPETDIDALYDQVKNSLSSSNSCKKEMKRVEELLDTMKTEKE